MNTTIADVITLLDGELLRGESSTVLTGFAALDDATSRQLSFYVNEKFVKQLQKTNAAAILVQGTMDEVPIPDTVAVIKVADAATAFDKIVSEFGFKPPEFVAGVAEGAHVASDCCFDESSISVQPGAVVLKQVSIGKGSLIQAGAIIGESVVIGKNCSIGPNVTIRENCIIGDRVIIHGNTTIGADGFGYEFENGAHRKVDQMGIVRIESDVEIGASTTIDRARFGETVIGEGTKIDNQVQIGHNAIIGKHCVIVAQTGVSGSAKLGNYVTLAARVGIAGHIEIADQTTVGGKSGVISSITEPGGTYFGYPAKPMKDTLRTRTQIKKLGGLLNRVTELEKKLEALDVSENSS